MTWQLWLAYVAVSSALIALPGPTVLLVTGYAAASGPRRALASLLGVLAADTAVYVVSAVGFGAVLMASAEAFLVLKWIGAAYLVYLGIQMWRAPVTLAVTGGDAASSSTRGAIGQAFVVTVLNPKSIIFFSAFVPQFMSPAAPALPQLVVLGATFLVLVTLILGTYALLMGNARRLLASPRALRGMQRTGGTLLIGAGILTATLRRTG